MGRPPPGKVLAAKHCHGEVLERHPVRLKRRRPPSLEVEDRWPSLHGRAISFLL
jgi:hypothetical protein